MRAAELVRRADQDVGVDLADVDRLVRGVVDRVDPRERAGVVRELAHALGVDHGPDRVRGPCERHHTRPRPELALEVRVVERRVVEQLDVADDQVAVVGELEPRRDAAVVVERGDEDLVAGRELAARGARQREVQRGHVRAEEHLVRLAPEEPRGPRLGLLEDPRHPMAGLVHRAEVRARLAERPGDRVADLVGYLRAPRRVEEGEPLLEGEEALACGGDVELVHHLSHR